MEFSKSDGDSNEIWINTLIERGLDLIITTIPPSLPVCLSIGTTTAIERIKGYSIICINRKNEFSW